MSYAMSTRWAATGALLLVAVLAASGCSWVRDVTGWGEEEDRRLSSQAGFDGHLVKPVDHKALNALMASHGSTRG